MEPRVDGQRRSKSQFERICPRLLIAWLRSPKGQPLREAIEEALLPNLAERLFDNSEESKRLQAEVIERSDKTVRAVVTVQPTEMGDVDVIAYGPHDLRVRIVCLPMVPPVPELTATCDKLVELELPKNYREVYKTMKAIGRVILDRRYFHFWEWAQFEKTRAANVAFSKAIEGKAGTKS